MQPISSLLSHLLNLAVLGGIAGLLPATLAQNSAPPPNSMHQDDATTEPSSIVTRPLSGSPEQNNASSALVIGPGDEVEVTVYGAPDLSQHTRVNSEGKISIPLIGYIRLTGLSSGEAGAAIEAQLRRNHILNDPQVSVYVKEYTGSGISVAGEVGKPGVYSALGPHRLFDVLQAA